MSSVSVESQADVNETFNLILTYLDDLLNINNIYFYQLVDRIDMIIYVLSFGKANSSDVKAPFLI